MRGKDITAASSHTAKLELENLTPWSAMEPIRESSPSLASKFSRGFLVTKIKINNIKSMCLCSKFTMKKFKTSSFLSIRDLKMVTKLGSTKPWASMWRDLQSIMSIPTNQLKLRWTKVAKIDLLLQLR